MKNDKILLPEVTSVQLFKLIEHIYPADQVSVDKLNGIFGKSKVANAGVTGVSIGIFSRGKSSIYLTDEGKQLGRALASKNLEEQRKILKELVLKNPVLEFIYSLVNEKKIIKNREIGQKIAMQFKKNWKHELSYARYGTNCGDILAAAGLGDYVRGIYSVEKIGLDNISEGVSSPALRFNKMVKVLTKLSAKEKNIETLSEFLKTKKGRLFSEIANCIDLNLIKRSGELYSITLVGRELINPIYNEDTRKNLFAEALRKSPYAKIVEIVEKTDSMDKLKIGQVLLHELKKEGKENYQYDMGKIFTNWLDVAGISCIERSKQTEGKQIKEKKKKEINRGDIKIIKKDPTRFTPDIPTKREHVSEIATPQANQGIVFKIGRLLERIEIKHSAKQDIVDDVKELIKICEADDSLKSYVTLLKSHFNLYLELKNFRIIEADLNFLRERFDK